MCVTTSENRQRSTAEAKEESRKGSFRKSSRVVSALISDRLCGLRQSSNLSELNLLKQKKQLENSEWPSRVIVSISVWPSSWHVVGIQSELPEWINTVSQETHESTLNIKNYNVPLKLLHGGMQVRCINGWLFTWARWAPWGHWKREEACGKVGTHW